MEQSSTNRSRLLDLAGGGDGHAPGIIYEDPQAEPTKRYYFTWTLPGHAKASTFYADTKDHAQGLIDLITRRQ